MINSHPCCSTTPINTMNRHFRSSSRISYASSTTSEISTIWGPGTLTGKALEAFGEATLRGIDNLVIRRKLTSLRSVFPHGAQVKNIEQVYDDILELSRYILDSLSYLMCSRPTYRLSRPRLYTKTIGQAAMRLLMAQIGSRNTYHLINGLDQWPEVEVRLFLSQVMSTYLLDVKR